MKTGPVERTRLRKTAVHLILLLVRGVFNFEMKGRHEELSANENILNLVLTRFLRGSWKRRIRRVTVWNMITLYGRPLYIISKHFRKYFDLLFIFISQALFIHLLCVWISLYADSPVMYCSQSYT